MSYPTNNVASSSSNPYASVQNVQPPGYYYIAWQVRQVAQGPLQGQPVLVPYLFQPAHPAMQQQQVQPQVPPPVSALVAPTSQPAPLAPTSQPAPVHRAEEEKKAAPSASSSSSGSRSVNIAPWRVTPFMQEELKNKQKLLKRNPQHPYQTLIFSPGKEVLAPNPINRMALQKAWMVAVDRDVKFDPLDRPESLIEYVKVTFDDPGKEYRNGDPALTMHRSWLEVAPNQQPQTAQSSSSSSSSPQG